MVPVPAGQSHSTVPFRTVYMKGVFFTITINGHEKHPAVYQPPSEATTACSVANLPDVLDVEGFHCFSRWI